jgi:hypothetical protein
VSFFHLVGGVAGFEVGAECPAFDGFGEDDGGLAGVFEGCFVGRVELAVVVAAAFEVPDFVVGHAFDEFAGAGVAAEEVFPYVCAGFAFVGLVVAVGGDVHQVDQGAVGVGGEQRVPFAAPDHFDHVPAGAAEEGFEFLDDFAVAADRAVEALEVAVDDEGQVVEFFAGGQADRAE